ncbi:MAG: EF-hand domain-containing protein [Nitrospirota bacterium]
MTPFKWRTWGAIVAAAALGLVVSGSCDWGLAKERQSRSSASKLKKKEKAVRGKTSVSSVQRIVEPPERFSRRVDWNRDGQIDPLEKAVAFDHFRQLDRNHDGMVDPMERALARLDIEYDGPVAPREAEWVQAQLQRAASRDGYARERGGSLKATKRPSHPKPVKRKGSRSATSPPTR